MNCTSADTSGALSCPSQLASPRPGTGVTTDVAVGLGTGRVAVAVAGDVGICVTVGTGGVAVDVASRVGGRVGVDVPGDAVATVLVGSGPAKPESVVTLSEGRVTAIV